VIHFLKKHGAANGFALVFFEGAPTQPLKSKTSLDSRNGVNLSYLFGYNCQPDGQWDACALSFNQKPKHKTQAYVKHIFKHE